MVEWKENLSGKAPCEVGVMVMVEFGDGSKSEGHVEDFYWRIDGDSSDICRWKFMQDQTETPEEKEALDMIDTTSKQVDSLANNSVLPNSSGWKHGDALSYYYEEGKEWRDGLYIIQDNGFHVVRDLDDDGYTGVTKYHIKKPESPEQQAERERLEAAYDLYLKVQERDEGPGFAASFKQFQDGMMSTCRKDYLSIVDITGYRKESK